MLLELMDFPKIMEDEDIVGWLRGAAALNRWDDRAFMSGQRFDQSVRSATNAPSGITP